MLPMFLAAAVLMAAADPPPAPGAPPAAKAEKPKAEKMVCHEEPRPGSRMTRRVCMTKAQADLREQESKEAVQDVHSRGNQPVAPSGGLPH